MKCILCDLEIPKGKESREHYLPKSRVPRRMWNNINNIFWAHYMLNAVKSNYLPCEFEELKFELTYQALKHWNIKEDDKDFLTQALNNWEVWHRNPCELCIAKCNYKER